METPNPRKGGVMPAPKKYPDEMRDRAIRLVLDIAEDAGSITAACRRIGEQLGINSDTLRGWVKQAQVDAGLRPGTATADAARVRQLERENAELRRANAILRTASAFFAAELDRHQPRGPRISRLTGTSSGSGRSAGAFPMR